MFCPRVVYLRVHQVSVAVLKKKKKKQKNHNFFIGTMDWSVIAWAT